MQPTYEELFSQNQALIEQVKLLTQQNQALTLQLKEAFAEIKALKAEVKELKEKLSTNSSNSSQPPSQDPFRPQKPKKPTGRRQGAQKGHPGYSRGLLPVEQVQIQHDLRPSVCPSCQSNDFDVEAIGTEVRQVVELPEIPPEVTQFNIHTCRCSTCGKHVKADIPNEAQFGFGPRLMGLVTSLSGEFRLSKRLVTALMGKIGIRICSGSVCKIHARASVILKQPYDDIKKYTLEQEHLNADETGWRTLATRRWIWTGCGRDSVFFEIKTRRSAVAFQEVFGLFKGGLTTDRHGAYNVHEGARQLCWSHADRDFEKIAGREGFDKLVGEQLLQCKSTIFDLWHSFKAGQIQRDELINRIESGPKEDLKLWLKAGIAHKDTQAKTKATCGDFFNRFDMLWVFIYKNVTVQGVGIRARARVRARARKTVASIELTTTSWRSSTPGPFSLNIAEGAGEFAGNEKSRFYRMAKRSATECAAVLDLCGRLELVEEAKHLKGREFLLRIVAMLTKMAQVCSNAS